MSDIFISYKREEQSVARMLADALESKGWSVWWDPKLRAGEHFDDVIENALTDAKCVIVLWSQRSIKSRYIKDEASDALKRKKLVPVAIQKVEPPFRFAGLHTVQLLDWDGAESLPEFQKLVADIGSVVDQAPMSVESEVSLTSQGEAPRDDRVVAHYESRRRLFWITSILAVIIACIYPLSLLWTLPWEYAANVYKNGLNYSVFYLLCVPLAVGIFVCVMDAQHLRRLHWGFWVLLVLLFVFSLFLAIQDAMDKGPPHPPQQFYIDSDENRQTIIDFDTKLRKDLLSKNPSSTSGEAIDRYVAYMAGRLRVRQQDIQRFNGFADFIHRGSLTAYVDLILSYLAGLFAITYFWYIFSLRITKNIPPAAQRNGLAFVFILFVFWFPCRVYALWYQSYYEFSSLGNFVPLLAVLAVATITILFLIYRFGLVINILAGTQALAVLGIATTAKFKPTWFGPIGQWLTDLPLIWFISVEAIILLLLFVVVTTFLDEHLKSSYSAMLR